MKTLHDRSTFDEMGLRIASEQCDRIGQRLRANDWPRREYGVLLDGEPPLPLSQLVDYYFFLCALLFDFRGFDITLDGRPLSGADAFLTLARRRALQDPEFFTSSRLAQITADDLNAVFSVTGNPAECRLHRNDERAVLLRDAAGRLSRDFAGHSAALLEATGGRLRHPAGTGLIDRLEQYAGYADPHFKKGFVLVKTLEGLGAWQARDRENLFIPVDYHLLRVALRAGMVEVPPLWAEMLRQRQPASAAQDDALRDAAKRAYKLVELTSGFGIFALDELFWTLGRSCCHYARPPRCHTCDFTHCTVVRSFDYSCPGRCPLSGICRGSLDPAYAALFETQITTVFY